MIRAALLCLLLTTPLAAQPKRPAALLPFHEVVKIVASRFEGRLLAVRIDQPRPFELALGSDLVQELTLLSPQGNIILLRIDAVSGKVLDVRGRGINAARVRKESPRAGTGRMKENP
ncbi:hypothetical protein FQV27_04095 [Paracoccus aurantiacus]|uniref:PepSY domain-containing protein n=1 Tax=Paracoccus aurantiacus TaxID=2599412 RepID=A0A5C6S925_9RHOB|nr:hypothetical protein [Paracoccus aurantiacus]TXB71037.1 hypothetical protein FQV27_04095 [Paracoccus aurantiacus]